MASAYPAALDSFATNRADGTANATTQAADHNNYADAINKAEAELGTNPSGSDATVAARLDRVETSVTATTQSGTSYTLALADAGTVVETTNASAVTVTVPPNSSAAFPTGSIIGLLQYGAGQITVSPGSGVTLRSPGAALKSSDQYSAVWLRKRATNEWVVSGDVTA
jgi:hypothetical protein